MGFLPAGIIPVLAIVATIGEAVFGLLILTGLFTRMVAIGSGILSFCFALAMAISFGVESPLGYSVFTLSAASFLLAAQPQYAWSLDSLRFVEKNNAQQIISVDKSSNTINYEYLIIAK